MKVLINWIIKHVDKLIIAIGALVGGTILGSLFRQPQVNRLKKQIKRLQDGYEDIEKLYLSYNDTFNDILIQYKGMKALELKKKAETKKKLTECLIYQYGTKDYLNILFDMIKKDKKISSNERDFFFSFDAVIEGRDISKKDMEIIKNFIESQHENEIKNMIPCDCNFEFKELNDFNVNQNAKRKKKKAFNK